MRLNIRLDLTSPQVSSRLLEGLDAWVKLGLLSEAQVREIALTMSEPLPLVYKPLGGEATEADEAAGELAPVMATEENQVLAPPNRIAQALAALVEEISVIWLLFLGVFLVVVSSGVLAASQWESFSPVGQYCVLFAYTLAFWAASIWAQRQDNLRSTGRMLALATMLLIPVNFWMMDRFGALSDAFGFAVCGVAAIALTLLPLSLSNELMPRRTNRINLVGLSWLHWGWGFAAWPVLATYIGAISTAANLIYQDRHAAEGIVDSPTTPTGTSTADPTVDPTTDPTELPNASAADLENSSADSGLSFDVLAVVLSGVILLVRSLLIAQVPPYQLGLAAGICGWLLVWLTRQKSSRIVWERVGFGLLVLGWIVTVGQVPPLQAIAISMLALNLLWIKLHQSWTRDCLLAVLGVSLQTYALVWTVLPTTLRDRLLTLLSTWFDIGTIETVDWASLGFFPFLLGMLGFAAYLRYQEQQPLVQVTEQITLWAGLFLALLSLGNSFTAAVNLTLSTATLAWVLTHRRGLPSLLLTLTHGLGLAAAASWIYYVAPTLSLLTWGCIALGGAITEFLSHPYLRSRRLQLNTWGAGVILAAISYGLMLASWAETPPWLWLSVPMVLTVVANHRQTLWPISVAKVATLGFLMQLPWLVNWPVAIASFAIAAICTGINSRIWRRLWAAQFTVGFTLLLIASVVWRGLLERMDHSAGRMTIFWMIVIWALWLIQRQLAKRSAGELGRLYTKALRNWAMGLMITLLLWGTLAVATILSDAQVISSDGIVYVRYLIASFILLLAALAERLRHRAANWQYYSVAWAAGIVVALALMLQRPASMTSTLMLLGMAALALGLIAQIAGDIWTIKHPPYRSSWHIIPVFYAGLGLWLGHTTFSASTGWFTIVGGLLWVGVGRRQAWTRLNANLPSGIGLLGLSIGAYELLIYQLAQASGGEAGDGVTLLAMLALLLTVLYRVTGRQLARYSRLPTDLITLANHGHWAVAGILCAIAPAPELSQPLGITLWTVTALLTSSYAVIVGNRLWTPQPLVANHATWTRVGLLGGLLCIAYDRFAWFPNQTGLLIWGGAIACGIGAGLYALPWERWGWKDEMRSLGLWLPLLTLTITWTNVHTQGLLIVAAFYAWMANRTDRIRLSYIGIALFDLALVNYLSDNQWLSAVTFSLIVSLSILYITEVEPYFRNRSKRQQKHWIRVLASGLVGVSTLYQTEVSEPILLFATVAVVLGILFIFAGLILKVRAFLYVGTATFVLQILRVLWLFISENSLLLWAVGIVLGLVFIWIAATFESRRSQVSSRLSFWTAALETWQ
ncbi:hypothetical protein [cf. Phormidesmis sp. LEGE 11477]|uniref:hypothetical protein n=1 Tax=cf. Phormidesmis sp. LEGE 11477 TaxID=1828680 RepID=UPI00188248AB|nr:hypothetical protein [cf. Phormidesmis sp. LEGE 11477]MBE9063087.1 hypothetical protein [cf. Phormidesmis sp. LEGE 11477]